jgi:hypothetical protein
MDSYVLERYYFDIENYYSDIVYSHGMKREGARTLLIRRPKHIISL